MIGHGYSDFLGSGEIIIVFIALFHLFLDDAGSPGMAVGPAYIGFQVENNALVGPVEQIVGRKGFKVSAAPAVEAVAGGVDVVLARFFGIKHIGIGIIAL